MKYISPTALGLWESDKEAFYRKYLVAEREYTPQSEAAAVGSAFDARVKSSLHHDLGLNDAQFELQTLFETQVEEQNRDFAASAAEHVHGCYVFSGAYYRLLRLLEKSDTEPKFEFTAQGNVEGVPLIGKPDLKFVYKSNNVIFDWKVNGYCSKHAVSPAKFYALCRYGYQTNKKNVPHKGYKPMNFKGMEIGEHWFEEVKKDWAAQLSIYMWLIGEPIGTDTVVMIDQIVAKPGSPPLLRIANHRARVSKEFQLDLVQRLKDCWETIQSEHIFQDLSLEESEEKCQILGMMSEIKDPTFKELQDCSKTGWKS